MVAPMTALPVIRTAPDCVVRAGALLGEGPLWVAHEQALYWVDIVAPRVHRFVPATGASTSWTPPFRIGSIGSRASGGFVGGTERGFVLIDPDFKRFKLLCDPEDHLPYNRFNDGKVDERGRFWAGTMDEREEQGSGALYRLDPDLTWTRIDHGYGVTNGPAFSPDGRRIYHSDSAERTIFMFDLAADGSVRNKRIFAQFSPEEGHPDGMTTDSEGCLWVAMWDGWCVRRLSTAGETIEVLPLPVQRPTSVAFGGAGLKQLFITSAKIGLDAPARAAQPLAGGLFMVETAVPGLPSPAFAG